MNRLDRCGGVLAVGVAAWCMPALATAAILVDPSGAGPVDWPALLEVVAAGPNGTLAAALAIFAAVYFTRLAGGVWVPWFRTDPGGATLALGYGVTAGVLNAALQGQVTAAGILTGVGAGFAAAGGKSVTGKIARALWAWILRRAEASR